MALEPASGAMSELTGVLLVDKPAGPTSHDVVERVRRLTGQRRIGHTGTLDPFATGLLPLCLGRATRLARFLSGDRKSYRAILRFGFETDTCDRTGKPREEPRPALLEWDRLEGLCREFVGRQEQVPPAFSSKRVHGERAHRLARAGAPVEPAPVTVEIYRLVLQTIEGERATIEAEVSSGTYIRSLARDIGLRWGVGAHLEELRRTSVGPLTVEAALDLEQIERESGRLRGRLLSPGAALAAMPELIVPESLVVPLSHGRSFPWDPNPGTLGPGMVRCHGPDGRFLAVAELVEAEPTWQLKPSLVWVHPGPEALG